MPNIKKGTLVISGILILVAVLSFTLLANIFSSQETYKKTIAEIDHEKANVTALLATSTAASAVISVLPDDTGSSIATELAQLSSVFLFILAFLYLEKYSLTIIGWLLFRYVIPCVCITLVIEHVLPAIHIFVKWAVNVLVFAALLLCVVIGGVRISGMIQETYQYSAQNVIDTVDEVQAAVTAAAQTTPEEPATAETPEPTGAPDPEKSGSNDIIGAIGSAAGNFVNGAGNMVSGASSAVSGAFSGAKEAVTGAFNNAVDKATEGIEWAKTILNDIVEAIAVLLVSCCVIPILTLLVVLYLGKRLLDLTPPENTVKVIQERFTGAIIHMNHVIRKKADEAR